MPVGPERARITFDGEAGRIEGAMERDKGSLQADGVAGRIANMRVDEAQIYEAALNHMARYAATEAGLARVLARKVDRWVRADAERDPEDAELAARQAKAKIPAVMERLRAVGVINDAAFAASRVKRLTRAGKSRRATLAHLAAKGAADAIMPDDPERELAAACAYLKRRRAGPFGNAAEHKVLAAMARGGFAQSVAREAMGMERASAEALIKSLFD